MDAEEKVGVTIGDGDGECEECGESHHHDFHLTVMTVVREGTQCVFQIYGDDIDTMISHAKKIAEFTKRGGDVPPAPGSDASWDEFKRKF